MSQPATKYITELEYLSYEREAEERHEYYKGEIFAMRPVPFKHNIVEDNLRGLLGNFLKGRKCRSFGCNLRIHIPQNTLYTYPDILIVCDEPKLSDEHFDTLLNPAVIIEILSPSTANYDRGAKFDLYREIESLKEYILIDSATIHFVHYVKNPDLTWTLSDSRNPDAPFFISTIGLQIPLSEVYSGVE